MLRQMILYLLVLISFVNLTWSTQPKLHVMINGLPGPMAMATAQVVLDRGHTLIPLGLTGNSGKESIVVKSKEKESLVELIKGPGFSGSDASSRIHELKRKYPNMVVVDYTHPSATLGNLKCYVENECDFVMGTTGGDMNLLHDEFNKGKSNIAVIAPNMAKQIVAVQAAILEMSKRFPSCFDNYKLTVTESHQSTKADTSGTAKAIVSHLATLNGKDFNIENIQKIRNKNEQLEFGVPAEYLDGHAYHTYRLVSGDNTVSFELQHNVCGRRVYAEGTIDAVEFIDNIRGKKATKRLYNMIDVLEQGSMK